MNHYLEHGNHNKQEDTRTITQKRILLLCVNIIAECYNISYSLEYVTSVICFSHLYDKDHLALLTLALKVSIAWCAFLRESASELFEQLEYTNKKSLLLIDESHANDRIQ